MVSDEKRFFLITIVAIVCVVARAVMHSWFSETNLCAWLPPFHKRGDPVEAGSVYPRDDHH